MTRQSISTLTFIFAALVMLSAQTLSAEAADKFWYHEAPSFSGEQRPYVPRVTPTDTPDHPFQGPDGQERTLADFQGRIVLVNFWATWCPPCVKEMPSLNTLQETLGGDDFTVVAFSLEAPIGTVGSDERIKSFLAENSLNALPPYRAHDPQQTFNAFRLGALPTSLVLGPDGQTIGTLEGPADWASPDAVALFRYLIDNQPGPQE